MLREGNSEKQMSRTGDAAPARLSGRFLPESSSEFRYFSSEMPVAFSSEIEPLFRPKEIFEDVIVDFPT